jgi:hypothetical protein
VIAGLDLAVRTAAVSVLVVAVVALEGEPTAVPTHLVAELARRVESVLGTALGAGVAGSAGQATVGAGEALLLLLVEESADVAVGTGGDGSGHRAVGQTRTRRLVIPLLALAHAVFPLRIGLQIAAIAKPVGRQPLADAAIALRNIAFKTLALVLGPEGIRNGRAARRGDHHAFGSVPEEAVGAETTVVVELASPTGDTLLSVPEGTSWADALRKRLAPGLTVGAGQQGQAGLAVEVGAVGALVADREALTSSPVHGGRALAGQRPALRPFTVIALRADGTISHAAVPVPMRSGGTGSSDAHALESVVVGTSRTILDGAGARCSIPVLAWGAGDGHAGVVVPDLPLGTGRPVSAVVVDEVLSFWALAESTNADLSL